MRDFHKWSATRVKHWYNSVLGLLAISERNNCIALLLFFFSFLMSRQVSIQLSAFPDYKLDSLTEETRQMDWRSGGDPMMSHSSCSNHFWHSVSHFIWNPAVSRSSMSRCWGIGELKSKWWVLVWGQAFQEKALCLKL